MQEKQALFGLFEGSGAGAGAAGLAKRLLAAARPYKNWPGDPRKSVRALDEFANDLSEYLELARRAGVELPPVPQDLKPFRRQLRLNPERMSAQDAFTHRRQMDAMASKLWNYVRGVANEEVAQAIDRGLEQEAARGRIQERRDLKERQLREHQERTERERLESEERQRAEKGRQRAIDEAQWNPYFQSSTPDEKKPWMSKSKGRMTQDLITAIESNKGMLPPDLQRVIPNLVKFVRMKAGTRTAGLLEDVYETRKNDIARLMWLFFGDRYSDATDFVNSVLWEMEDVWNREDFPAAEEPAPVPAPAPQAAEAPQATPPEPAPAGEVQVAPSAAPPAEPAPEPVSPEAPARKGLPPGDLIAPTAPTPTTIIEKGKEDVPAEHPPEKPRPKVPRPNFLKQYKRPLLGR